MLWSLVKILVFVAIVGLLTSGAAFLLETEGGLRVEYAGMEYALTPLQTVLAAAAVLLAMWLLLKMLSFLGALVRFLNGDETAISRYFDRGREQRGYRALADGMMALASGEARLAMNKAAQAETCLQKPELTNLLTAQAAEMSGDTKKATKAYKALIRNDRTRFIGVRGIMHQKLAEGDTDTAHKLAEQAFNLKPHHEEVQDTLLRLQARAHDWSGARTTLGAKLKSRSLPRDVYTRREAILALSEASDLLNADASIEAHEDAIQANRLSPDLIPAAAMAARSYIRMGRPGHATRVIRRAWQAQPHPDLAAAFAEVIPDESATERLNRFAQLTSVHPDNPETRLVKAELLIVAEQFPEARRVLLPLVESNPDARVLTLMAAVERGQGASDAVIRSWLARALAAPRGPQWVCGHCNHAHAAWQPVCDRCEAFDTLGWEPPAAPELISSAGIHMLPLIVGPGTGVEPPGAENLPAVALSQAEDAKPAKDTPEPGPARGRFGRGWKQSY